MGKVELRVEIDAALLTEAEAAGVALDAALEAGVRRALEHRNARPLDLVERGRRQAADPVGAAARARAWAEENADAIRAHNDFVAAHSPFGEEWRRW